MIGLSQEGIAAVLRATNPKVPMTPLEIEAWQQAIDSQLVWRLGPEIGEAAVQLIRRGTVTLARRSYCRAPKAALLGSPPPLPLRRRRHMTREV